MIATPIVICYNYRHKYRFCVDELKSPLRCKVPKKEHGRKVEAMCIQNIWKYYK